jgi:hypothetical protein
MQLEQLNLFHTNHNKSVEYFSGLSDDAVTNGESTRASKYGAPDVVLLRYLTGGTEENH